VFDLDGRVRHAVAPLDRPNNVDVEYGFTVNGRPVDIAVLTERRQHRLRVFEIRADGTPRDLAPSGIRVLAGETGEAAQPMGLALYKRPRDGAIFAIVSPKTGGASNYLWQYRLDATGGAVTGRFVRRFGAFSRLGPTPNEVGEIEAIAVDDELGFVYYADEQFGIHKWHADPDHSDASRELAVIGREGYRGDREGLAIYPTANGGGYLVSSDQVPGGTRLMVYSRTGSPDRPHAHPLLATIPTTADATDGLDVTARALPGSPDGLLVMMNSGPKNFLIFDWRQVASRLGPTTTK
jgi:3-phytase